MRVLLLVTGRCEQKALGSALKRLFPDVTFESAYLEGFTSNPVPRTLPPPTGLPTKVETIAGELVAAIEPGQRANKPYDLVFAIEDLELCNASQPELVVNLMREAVNRHLETASFASESSRRKARERARTRCSFHLLVPMVESYFFGEADTDSGALRRAGACQKSAFVPAMCDVEKFHVEDIAFVDRQRYPDGLKQSGIAVPWTNPQREQHPKHYVSFLCEPDLAIPGQGRYQETRGGAEALRLLDWAQVLGISAHGKFLRSLIADLAEGLGRPMPLPGELASLTEPKPGNSNALLRNL